MLFPTGVAALTFLLAGSTAFGQQNTADLEKMNAIKLGKTELDALLPGTRVQYSSARGLTFVYDQKPDGEVANGHANGVAIRGNAFAAGQGTWRVNERGQYCIDTTWGRNQPFDVKWCSTVYQIGNDYFLTFPTRPDDAPLKMTVNKL